MLSYKYYINTVTRTVSKHTTTFPSCYHINIILTQSPLLSNYATLHPVFSLIAVTRHTKHVGKFCDLLFENCVDCVLKKRESLYPCVVERGSGGVCRSAIRKSKLYKCILFTHCTVNCINGTVNCMHGTVNCIHGIVKCIHGTVNLYVALSSLYMALPTVYTALSTVNMALSTLYVALSTVYITVNCIDGTVNCILDNFNCICHCHLYTRHCQLYT